MTDNATAYNEKPASSKLIRLAVLVAIVLIAFLAGLIPMTLQKWSVQDELAIAQKKLRQSEIKGLLTSAIVEAKRGEYEPARKSVSDFFTRLDVEQKAEEGERYLKTEDLQKLIPVFDDRDAIITMLAQRDPASVERLTNIYINYLQVAGVSQPDLPDGTSQKPPPANADK